MTCEWFRNMKVKVQYGGPGHLLLHLSYFRTMYDSLVFANDLRVCFFIKRSGNSVAHFLTRHAKFIDEMQVWIESILDDITPFVFRDSTQFYTVVYLIYLLGPFQVWFLNKKKAHAEPQHYWLITFKSRANLSNLPGFSR